MDFPSSNHMIHDSSDTASKRQPKKRWDKLSKFPKYFTPLYGFLRIEFHWNSKTPVAASPENSSHVGGHPLIVPIAAGSTSRSKASQANSSTLRFHWVPDSAATQHGARYSAAWDYLASPGLYYDPTDKLFVVPGGRTSLFLFRSIEGLNVTKAKHTHTHTTRRSLRFATMVPLPHLRRCRSRSDRSVLVFCRCYSLSLSFFLRTLSLLEGKKSRRGTGERGHFYRGHEDHEQRPERRTRRADAGQISTERAPATDVRRISDLRPTRPKREPPVGPFPFIPCLGFFVPGVSLRGFANNYGSTIVNVPTDWYARTYIDIYTTATHCVKSWALNPIFEWILGRRVFV